MKHFVAGTASCRASILALRDASLVVDRGEVVVLVGAAGAGKSTLLLCAAGLLKPDAGTVRWCGTAVRDATRLRYAHTMSAALREHPQLVGHDGALLVVDVLLESLNGEERREAERLIGDAASSGTALLLCARRFSSVVGLSCRAVVVERGVTTETFDAPRRRRARVAECDSSSVDSLSGHP